jgi:methionyl-tRNA formyltransferase
MNSDNKLNFNIIIAGKNEMACNMLSYMLENFSQYNYYVIVNKTDDGVDSWQPSLKKKAQNLNIKIINLKDAYNMDCLFLSCEFDKIIKPDLFNSKKLFNIHFSKLPQYKGVYTSCLPILFNEKETGVTLHKIDAGIDTGDIIEQYIFPILSSDVALDIYLKYNKYGFELLKKNILNIINDDFKCYKQSSVNASYYSLKTLDFKNINIDYRKTANEIKNQIHAYSFVHYQLPLFNDNKITHAEILPEKSNYKIKEIVEETSESITINTIDFNIKLYKCNT